jgi:hypothetical protein
VRRVVLALLALPQDPQDPQVPPEPQQVKRVSLAQSVLPVLPQVLPVSLVSPEWESPVRLELASQAQQEVRAAQVLRALPRARLEQQVPQAQQVLLRALRAIQGLLGWVFQALRVRPVPQAQQGRLAAVQDSQEPQATLE